mgnify:FL=1
MARRLNILLINHYAGTPSLGMEYRPYYLAREWVRAGHRVTGVAANVSHVRTHQSQAGEEEVDGITYRWLPTPGYQGNGLGRVRNIWHFLRQVWQRAPALVTDCQPDMVIASSTYPMDIWVARRIARLAGAKLVYEVHDLWPLSPIELSGMSPNHPFIVLCQAAENYAYRHSDVVISMACKADSYMAEHGLDLRKFHHIPNGISPEDWDDQPALTATRLSAHLQSIKTEGKTVVGYAGSHGLPNALDFFLDAAALLQDMPLAFVLVGDGHEKQRLEQRVKVEGLRNVAFFDPVPKAQIPSLLQQFDIAYIGWQRVPLYRFGIAPNKLMDYMMARCAVLHSVEAGNDPVAEANCGLTVAPESAVAIADGLRRLTSVGPTARHSMGVRGRAHVLSHHTYPVLAQRFLQAIS